MGSCPCLASHPPRCLAPLGMTNKKAHLPVRPFGIRGPEDYFAADRFDAPARRALYRLAVFFLISPFLAALSMADTPPA